MLFDKFIKCSRLVGKIRSIRLLTLDIAIVVAVNGIVMAGQSDVDPERNSIHMLVDIKQNDNWYFYHISEFTSTVCWETTRSSGINK
jgi:hypothetical protein